MMDLERARVLLNEGGYTCVLCRGDTFHTATARGVRPLVDWLDSGLDLANFCAADKVVGRATAFLYVLLKVRAVHALVMSTPAKEVLEAAGIPALCDREVPGIINRRGDGPCPFEEAVLGIRDPAQALTAIRKKQLLLRLPPELAKLTAGQDFTLDRTGLSGSTVAIFGNMVLKCERVSEESENQDAMLRWLAGKLPVPRVICSLVRDGFRWTLMERISGEMACAERWREDPHRLVRVLADAMRQLWDLDSRGMPRLKPPFPAEKGYLNKPSNINNVETFANVAWIILNGGAKFAAMGTENSKGTKVFALTGKIRRGGLVEIPMGLTLREVIFGIGGGIRDGKRFKAVQMGGPSGGCIPESLLDTRIDYRELGATGAIMGSGGMVVMDETTCMVNMAKFFLDFTARESCGKCVHCRIGTRRLHEILTRITEGRGKEGDVELLEELCRGIKDGALCGLGQTAPNPVLTTIRYFRDEYDAHIRERRCPAGECAALRKFKIDPAKCKGCGACARKCPVKAIAGEPKKPYAIDPAKCIGCGSCEAACRFGAVAKA